MTTDDLIFEIQSELSGSGMLPELIKNEEVKRVINQAKLFFYDRYKYGTEETRLIVPLNVFQTQEFKRSRSLILPDNFLSVHKVRECRSTGTFNTLDQDFSENRIMASVVYMDNMVGDDLVLKLARAQMISLTKAFMLTDISYKYNKNNKKLQITGRDPKYKVLIVGYAGIEDEALMDDHVFIRYCTAKTKESFARIIGMYSMPLPGGIEINIESLRSEAEAEIEEIMTRLKEINPPNWFLMFN